MGPHVYFQSRHAQVLQPTLSALARVFEVSAAKREVLKLLEEVRDVRETNEMLRPAASVSM